MSDRKLRAGSSELPSKWYQEVAVPSKWKTVARTSTIVEALVNVGTTSAFLRKANDDAEAFHQQRDAAEEEKLAVLQAQIDNPRSLTNPLGATVEAEVKHKYEDEGDLAMYTTAALDQRCRLRFSTPVVTCLHLWWAAIARDQEANGRPADGLVYAEYVAVFLKLCKAMYQYFDPQEAEEAIREDWDRDSGGGEA